MLVDRSVSEFALTDVGQVAAEAEVEGYDGIWVLEASHDPFVPLFLAADRTTSIDLATSISVAFARNPMTTASVARDLQDFSGGRFTLGLGPQIKAHIQYRYSMPADRPVDRMRDYVAAVRAIWDCWDNGTKLSFEGEFYTHTLMPPLFHLEPTQPPPPIALAGVGPRMTALAGEVADGFVAHSFTSESYLREVTLPILQTARRSVGRELDGFLRKGLVLVATGHTDQQMAVSLRQVREWLAFYGSTPAYAPVLEHHGWGELHTELHALSRSGRWAEMSALVDDDVLNTIAFVGAPADIGPMVNARYRGIFDRVEFYHPSEYVPEVWADVISGFKETT